MELEYEGFQTWEQLLDHIAAGYSLFYQAPLDYRPAIVQAVVTRWNTRANKPTKTSTNPHFFATMQGEMAPSRVPTFKRGVKMADSFFRDNWQSRRRARIDSRASGSVQIQRVMSRIQVSVPYHPDFVVGAHKLYGRWRKRSSVWSFPGDQMDAIKALIQQVFGV